MGVRAGTTTNPATTMNPTVVPANRAGTTTNPSKTRVDTNPTLVAANPATTTNTATTTGSRPMADPSTGLETVAQTTAATPNPTIQRIEAEIATLEQAIQVVAARQKANQADFGRIAEFLR